MSALLDRFLDSSRTVESLHLDADGRVTHVNEAFAGHAGRPAASVVGAKLDELVAAHEGERVLAWCRGITGPPPKGAPVSFLDANGRPYTLWCHVECDDDRVLLVGEPDVEADKLAAADLMRLNNEMATLSRENMRRRREAEEARSQLEQALADLRTSHWHLQKIQEVMPICMRCGKVKSGETTWQSVAEYFLDNRIFMSHGFCPVCAAAELESFGLSDED